MDNQNFFYHPKKERPPQNNGSPPPREHPSLTKRLLDKIAPGLSQVGPLGPKLDLMETLENHLTRVKKSIDWNQNLQEMPFAVFDLETTGLQPYRGDEIISIGAVLIDQQTINRRSFHQLVNPGRELPPTASKITGIREEDLEDQPPIEVALAQFLDFVGARILVAHHAAFDLAFLNLKLGNLLGAGIANPVIDTARLAFCLEPSLKACHLENLCSYYGIKPEGRHTALGDAYITARIFLRLLPQLEEQGVSTLAELARLHYLSPDDYMPNYPLIFD